MRFSALAEQLEVVSDRVLSERLKELEREGILERRVFAETPVRIEYALTEKGKALSPIIAAIEAWSYEWVKYQPEVEAPEPSVVCVTPVTSLTGLQGA